MSIDETNINKRRSQLSQTKQTLLGKWLQGDLEEETQKIPRRLSTVPAKLSHAQQLLWFLDQLEPDNPVYNIHTAVRLLGQLDLPVLAQCLKEIIRRHDVLRTTFDIQDEEPVQIIKSNISLPLYQFDLQTLPSERREKQAQEILTQEVHTPFNLAQGPLLRVVVVQLKPTETIIALTMHHIISDGWSLGILVEEISTLYSAFIQGLPSSLPDPPIQYADFAVWQRAWLEGERLQAQLNYWKKQLDQSQPDLNLPTDYVRLPVYNAQGTRKTFALTKSLSQVLKTTSQETGVTLFTVLLAAFKVLLHRYTGQTDINIGTPNANRNQREIETLIGLFVNTLVLRTDLSGNPSVRELMKRVHEVTLDAQSNQDLPFERLIQELKPDRDLSRPPLFQVMFALHNTPRSTLKLPGLALVPQQIPVQTAMFDLTIDMIESEGKITGTIEYNTHLFAEATIDRLICHFQMVLESVVANPGQRLSELQLLTNTELAELLHNWQPAAVSPPDRCVHQLFEAQVSKAPESIAAIHGQSTITYSDLNKQANHLAHYLQKQGVGPGVLVAICVERSFHMLTAILGVLKAGGVFVPLDPSFPPERLSFILEDTEASLLLSQSRLTSIFPNSVETVCLDTHWPEIAIESSQNPVTNVTAQSLAYIIYTSGSTGRPKGISITHSALVHYIQCAGQQFSIAPEDRMLQFASLSFDTALEEIFLSLMHGAGIVLRPHEMLDTIPAFWQMCHDLSLTVIDLPTAFWHYLCTELTEQESILLPSLRLVIIGGEQASTHALKRWQKNIGSAVTLFNTYGPSETTIVATSCDLTEITLSRSSARVPIGQPIPGVQVYVLDRYMQPVPIGVVGELYIGGNGLARGYWKQPGRTAENFVPDPFKNGTRLYKTGDIVRYKADGYLEFIGRADRQIKLRGYRIELNEIESVLDSHLQVRQCAVVVQEDTNKDKYLIAYVVPKAGQVLNISQLRQFIRTKLPEYMVPTSLLILDELPQTSSHKTDRQALVALTLKLPRQGESVVQPRTPVEAALRQTWQELLKLETIGINENFFERGGHSLLATRLNTRIQDIFEVALPLRTLFESPTIVGLAQEIETALRSEQFGLLPKLEPQPRSGKLPLSFAQQRLWFLAQLEPQSAAYNMPLALRLQGSLDIKALEQSIGKIVQRHENLRTVFPTVKGEPVQEILPAEAIKLSLIDLSHMPGQLQQAEVKQQAQAEAEQPFDLASDPLLRVKVLSLGGEEQVLLLTMHHIISDGWSMDIMGQELAAFYKEAVQDIPATAAPLPVQYADFAAWQRDWLQGEILAAQVAYWKEQLTGAPSILSLPTDRARPAVQSARGGLYTHHVGSELTSTLRHLGQSHQATLFMTLLSSFNVLLARYSQMEDIVVGTPIANRRQGEVQNLIGFFVNMLPLRTRLAEQPTFLEVLGQVRQTALEAYAHQDIPFEKLVDELNVARDMSHAPVFQVVFSLQTNSNQQVELPGLTLTPLAESHSSAKYDLTLIAAETEEGLYCTWEYSTDLFEAETIARLARHWQTLLRSIVTAPERNVQGLNMLTPVERETIVHSWNRNKNPDVPEMCLHEFVERHAQERPLQTAVSDQGERLSYGELNQRANQLAAMLQRHQVAEGGRVGIHMAVGVEMIVAIVAIHKAGAAYIPFDPDYPTARLQYMLEDAQPTVLLTDARLDELSLGSETMVLSLDEIDKLERGTTYRPSVQSPWSPAYIIYTSGSTGKPKGAVLNHIGVVNHADQFQRWQPLVAGQRASLWTSLNFDVSVYEIFSALMAGAALHIVPSIIRPDAQAVVRWLAQEQIHSAFLPPFMVPKLAEMVKEGEVSLELTRLLVGVEPLNEQMLVEIQERVSGLRIFNGYGPTEATICCTVYPVPAGSRRSGNASIGRPVQNMQVYLLNKALEPVPVGVPGELYIGGIGLAQGYYERPELTAERFIAANEDHALIGDATLYRTGDLATYLPDGNIQFIGRTDYQVKVRGFRVELGEIETILLQHPAIKAVVVQLDQQQAQGRLVAYVVYEEEPQEAAVRAYLQVQLPDYMVPSLFITLEAMPRTPNDKIDRQALHIPQSLDTAKKEYVPPEGVLEERLAQIWCEVFGVEQIGRFDDFFFLGGHSLLITQLSFHIVTVFGLQLPLRSLFENSTVVDMAILIEERMLEKIEVLDEDEVNHLL